MHAAHNNYVQMGDRHVSDTSAENDSIANDWQNCVSFVLLNQSTQFVPNRLQNETAQIFSTHLRMFYIISVEFIS